MIRYAMDLIVAHGDTLYTKLSSNGSLELADVDYSEPFDKASTNLRQIRELTDTIPKPNFIMRSKRLPYAIPSC